MGRMNGKIIGLLIIVAAIGIGLYFYFSGNHLPEVTIEGYIGGEKIGVFENEKVQKIFKNDYSLHVDYVKAGSIEMVQENTGEMDFLFPSSQIALEIFKETQANRLLKSSNPFNSPIVLYSWDIVVEALEKEGIVFQQDGVYYADMEKLLEVVEAEKSWKEIGINELYGKISIVSTDPTKSNSGNQFVGLLAKIMNDGNGIGYENLDRILERLLKIYKRLGYLEYSSGDLFTLYLRTGVGAKPIIVGYENQLIEFKRDNPEIWDQVKSKIRIIYPVPTVWSSHIIIALKEEANRLIDAFNDERVQEIIWEDNGFRTGLTGIINDPIQFGIEGIAAQVQQVIPMPTADIMTKIIETFEKQDTSK